MKLIRHEIHEEGENNSVKVKVSFKTEKKGAYET
jgi:hypothetical protein